MALLFIDGFESYPNALSMIQSTGDYRWYNHRSTSQATLNSTTYRTTQVVAGRSRSIYCNWRDPRMHLAFPENNEVIIGFAFYPLGFPSDADAILAVGNGVASSSSNGIALGMTPAGQLAVVTVNNLGSRLTTLGTGTGTVSTNTWNYIEVRFKAGVADGEAEVRLNGLPDINLTNINTINSMSTSGYTEAALHSYYYQVSTYYDDFYLADTTGTKNNTFLGPIHVYTQLASGAGSNSDMTPVGAASNWQAVSESTVDDGTSYVESNTNGHRDLYAFEDLPSSGISSVLGVQLNVRGTVDSGNRGLFFNLKEGINTISSGLRNFVAGSWVFQHFMSENDPAGADWTKTTVDNTEAGYTVD